MNKILFLVLFFVFQFLAFGQTFINTFGGINDDIGRDIKQTVDGGFIIVGQTSSNDTGTLLLKTDSLGNEEWNTVNGSSIVDRGYSVELDGDSAYIAKAYTGPFKTDLSGNLEFFKDWSFNFMSKTIDEDYILSGRIRKQVLPDIPETLEETDDILLYKMNSQGTLTWSKSFWEYGDNNDEVGFVIKQTLDSGYVLTVGPFFEFPLADNLLKIDNEGNKVWQYNYGIWIDDVVQSADSGFVMVGENKIIKVNSQGSFEWEKTFEATLKSIEKINDLGYIITGHTNVYGAGGDDVFLLKIDLLGNEQWRKVYGGIGEDIAYSVDETTEGYVLTGSTTSYGNGSTDVLIIHTESDYSNPVALNASLHSINGFTANWTDGQTNDGYYIDIATDSLFSNYVSGYENLDVGNVNSFEVSALDQGYYYYYRVRAYNNYGSNIFGLSGNSNFILVCEEPYVQAKQASNILSLSFSANWNVSPLGFGYFLDVAYDVDFTSYVTGYENLNVGNYNYYNVDGLTPETDYYYRVRGYNLAGTGSSSNVINAYTIPELILDLPTVNTLAISNITLNSADAYCQIQALGDSIVSQYGVCWNTTGNPDVNDNVTNEGTLDSTKFYYSSMTNLLTNTQYYFRAYAINSSGISYGSEISFSTFPTEEYSEEPIGSGTIGDPYQIENLQNLLWMSENPEVWNSEGIYSYYIQTNNIDAGATSFWHPDSLGGYSGWYPISCLYGNYDGNGHIIENLFINRPTKDYVGLFATIRGVVNDLGIANCNVSGSAYTGGLVGKVLNNPYDWYYEVINCFSTGIITGDWFVGGLVGYNEGRTKDSYSRADVTGNRYVGGFAGIVSTETAQCDIYNSYSTGSVTGSSNVGGFTGKIGGDEMFGSVVNCFWDMETSGISSSLGLFDAAGKTTEEMKDISTYLSAGWDFVGETENGIGDIWFLNSGCNDGYPCFPMQSIPQSVELIINGGDITITWDEVEGAVFYKILSSINPNADFTDISNFGTFIGCRWESTSRYQHKFYKIVAIFEEKSKEDK